MSRNNGKYKPTDHRAPGGRRTKHRPTSRAAHPEQPAQQERFGEDNPSQRNRPAIVRIPFTAEQEKEINRRRDPIWAWAFMLLFVIYVVGAFYMIQDVWRNRETYGKMSGGAGNMFGKRQEKGKEGGGGDGRVEVNGNVKMGELPADL